MKKTKDLYFAAALITCGAELDHVDKSEPRHMEFCFKSTEDTELTLDEIELQWANGTLVVGATSYAEAIKRIKSVVHSA